MSDEQKQQPKQEGVAMSDTEFFLGYDNERDPKVMIINIPIQWATDDIENGTSLLRGKFDEAKQLALSLIQRKRIRKQQQMGILKPSGDALKVS